MQSEKRTLKGALRAKQNAAGGKTLAGRIPFNSRSELLSEGGKRFIERIAPGAFNFPGDTRALINHASYPVLGRASNGTLRIKQTGAGLEVECDLPDTQAANDLYTSVQRGDVNGLSFNFDLSPGAVKDTWDYTQTPPLRTLNSIQSTEVSFVGDPAYAASAAKARALDGLPEAEAGPATAGEAAAWAFAMEVEMDLQSAGVPPADRASGEAAAWVFKMGAEMGLASLNG